MPDGVKILLPEVPKNPERIISREAPKEGAVEVRGEKKTPERVVPIEKKDIPVSVPFPTVPPIPIVVEKTQMQQDIEDILADNLKELFVTLTPQQKIHFKQQGEKTAAHIEVLMKSVSIKISEILHLIRIWLALLPGVNKFFLEKEVKIKTEQILNLKEQESEYK